MATPLPLPRGGIRNRAAGLVADARAYFNRASHLFEDLLEKFAWGQMTAKVIREVAAHACEDNPSPPRDLKGNNVFIQANVHSCIYTHPSTYVVIPYPHI